MWTKTASSWWAKGLTGLVAVAAERILGVAHSIHFPHSPATAPLDEPAPSLLGIRAASISSLERVTRR